MYTSAILSVIVSAIAVVSQAKPIQLEARKSMSGDATYYDVGLGSCGESNSNEEMVAALSKDLMNGPNSPYCGQTVHIKGGSGSVSVKVVDTCPGCEKGSIDLSPAAFKKLGELGQGRIPITWSM